MSYFLKLNLFSFDATTDFLPYYKTLDIQIDKDLKVSNLLDEVLKSYKDFFLSKNRYLAIKVNNIVTFLDTPIKSIIERTKTNNLTIEPLSEYRVVHDLEINSDDFYQKFDYFNNSLGGILDENDKKEYEKLISYHYSSIALEFEREYFGDSFFIFSYYLMQKYPKFKKEILKTISDEEFGIWLYVNIKNVLIDNKKADMINNVISSLKREIIQILPSENSMTKRETKRLSNFKI